MFKSMPNTLKEIVRLRWISIGAQLFTFLSVISFLDARLPIFWIAASLGLSCVGNLLLPNTSLEAATKIGVLLIFDALILTVLLLLSGGPSNPFSVFFLTQVALAAVFARPLYQLRFRLLLQTRAKA